MPLITTITTSFKVMTVPIVLMRKLDTDDKRQQLVHSAKKRFLRGRKGNENVSWCYLIVNP